MIGIAIGPYNYLIVTGTPAIGTPSLRADTQVASGSRSTLTIGKPAGTADGDLLVAQVVLQTTGVITPPAGWTLIRSTLFSASVSLMESYWKVASGEGASWDWTFALSTCNGWVGAYTGCKITNVAAEIVSSTNPNQAGVTNAVANTVTTTGDNSLLVGLWACGGSRTYTKPADMTDESQTSGPSTLAADMVQATAGASGNKTAVISASAAACGQLIGLRASGT